MDKPRVSQLSSDPKPPFTKATSFNYSAHQTLNSPSSTANFAFAANDRRYAYSRQSSLQRYADPRSPTVSSSTGGGGGGNVYSQPVFSRSVSSIDIPPAVYAGGSESDYGLWKDSGKSFAAVEEKLSLIEVVSTVLRVLRTGNRPMKRLFLLISLNVAYSTAELFIGLLSGRVGLVSDAFHLTFGCGLLTFSLFAMAISRRKADRVYSYGYRRLEVLSAFTNATAVSSVYVILIGC